MTPEKPSKEPAVECHHLEIDPTHHCIACGRFLPGAQRAYLFGIYKEGLGHEFCPLVPHNHSAGLLAVYDAGKAQSEARLRELSDAATELGAVIEEFKRAGFGTLALPVSAAVRRTLESTAELEDDLRRIGAALEVEGTTAEILNQVANVKRHVGEVEAERLELRREFCPHDAEPLLDVFRRLVRQRDSSSGVVERVRSIAADYEDTAIKQAAAADAEHPDRMLRATIYAHVAKELRAAISAGPTPAATAEFPWTPLALYRELSGFCVEHDSKPSFEQLTDYARDIQDYLWQRRLTESEIDALNKSPPFLEARKSTP